MREGKTRILDAVEIAVDQFSAPFGLQLMEHWGLVGRWTDTIPAGVNFTTDFAADDELDATAHGLVQEQKVQLTTGGTLPAGLATTTDYWVIFIDANTLELALSLADARAGTQIDITDDGTGTHTITATALSVTMTVQYAARGETAAEVVEADWIDSTLNFVMTPSPLIDNLSDSNVGYRWMRMKTEVGTGGSGLLTVDINAKGAG